MEEIELDAKLQTTVQVYRYNLRIWASVDDYFRRISIAKHHIELSHPNLDLYTGNLTEHTSGHVYLKKQLSWKR